VTPAYIPPSFEDEARWLWADYLAETTDPEPYTLDEFTEANYRTIVETMMENDW
jgi:hypothetical protein